MTTILRTRKARLVNNPISVHRDPYDYDLPYGDWICKACAMERLGVKRSAFAKAVDTHGIDRRIASPMAVVAGLQQKCAFFNAADVARAVRFRDGADGEIHEMQPRPASYTSRPSDESLGAYGR